MDTPSSTQQTAKSSRGIRLLAFGLMALAINGFWQWCGLSDAVEPGYALCWSILIWAVLGTVPAFALGFVLALCLERWGRAGVLALLILGLCIAAAWQQWNLLAPGLLLGALAGIADAGLGALFRRLLAGCAAVYALNATFVFVGAICAFEPMQGGADMETVCVGTDEKNLSKEHWEEWRGCKVEAPIPFFLPQDALLLQVNGGNIELRYGGHRPLLPEWTKGGPDWVPDMQRGRYALIYLREGRYGSIEQTP